MVHDLTTLKRLNEEASLPENQKFTKSFSELIKSMNQMYDLPTPDHLVCPEDDRLYKFFSILKEELDEIVEVLKTSKGSLKRSVSYADLLGDLIVYCWSEATIHGIPIEGVLEIIMASNASKLGEDGKPIKDERGKFLKGPNYWKPEEKILQLLLTKYDDRPKPNPLP